MSDIGAAPAVCQYQQARGNKWQHEAKSVYSEDIRETTSTTQSRN